MSEKKTENEAQDAKTAASLSGVGSTACSVMRFAVLRLSDLRLYRFEYKDDMLDAIRTMTTRGCGFVPLIWHVGADTWTVPETIQ